MDRLIWWHVRLAPSSYADPLSSRLFVCPLVFLCLHGCHCHTWLINIAILVVIEYVICWFCTRNSTNVELNVKLHLLIKKLLSIWFIQGIVKWLPFLFSISSAILDGIVLYRLRNHRKHYHHYCRQLNLLISFGSYNKYQLKAKGIRGGYICAQMSSYHFCEKLLPSKYFRE